MNDNNKPADQTPPSNDQGKQGDDGKNANLIPQEKVNEIVASRVNEVKSSLTKEFEATLNAKLEEQKKLSEMSEKERQEALLKKQQAEYEAREQKVAIRENRVEALNKFAEYGLPNELVDYCVNVNIDATMQSVDNFKSAWDRALKKAIDSQLGNNPPKDFNNTSNNTGNNGKPDIITVF